ncbi:hypothetical protein [Undibacterium fentianense]|uniref:Uncharacterized protein n=1 Tax=Undibacterium fentianense TaxID=2828728 RepID=A0A941E4K1_9BURK|nr:hypothetical protein [Undibacterium fentianense]MBR7801426.1 hypothetical protein [Undibacterium fentianense]
MRNIDINPQSRRELNASIILAAMLWSFTMIFGDELIISIGRTAFSLLPILPIAVFGIALIRHVKRTGQSEQSAMRSNIGLATAFTVVFVCGLGQVKGAGFAQITAMAAYTCFAAALSLIWTVRRVCKC